MRRDLDPDLPPRPTGVAKASRALGVPIAWLKEEADAGRIPCLRAGKNYLFDLEILRAIIMDRVRSGDAPQAKRLKEATHVDTDRHQVG